MSKIEMIDVSYRYPLEKSNALNGIDLKAESGQLIGIIGNNGSGKTTVCNALRRFAPDFFKGKLTGDVLIDRRPIQEYSSEELSKIIGFVSQNPFAQITGATETVFEEIAFGLENLGYELETVKNKVQNIIKKFSLENIADKNPLALSGGQKQKVALAAVIAMDPDIFIIDEPTSQLDPVSSKEIFSMISELKGLGKCIILVEHKMELMAECADYIYLVCGGHIQMEGTPEDVFGRVLEDEVDISCPKSLMFLHELKKRGLISRDIKLPVKEQETLDLLRKELRISADN